MPLPNKHKCPYCPMMYVEKWAYDNHVKVCPHRFRNKDGSKKNN